MATEQPNDGCDLDSVDWVSVDTLVEADLTFVIPSYQRGYRWTPYNVAQLVDDLLTADERDANSHYCLQPLVVRQDEEGRLRVVDGQQRLTTLWLILKASDEQSFTLEYERGGINAASLNAPEEPTDSPDLWYMHRALEKLPKKGSPKARKLLNAVGKAQFIWFPLDKNDSAVETSFFTKLNAGKIQLTESELIKALLLGHYDTAPERQNSLVEELDRMERRLREPDFWAFLGQENDRGCHLDLVYALVCGGSLDYDPKQHPLYGQLAEEIGAVEGAKLSAKEREKELQKRVEAVMQRIRHAFHTLEGWKEDALSYNLVGYLLNRRGGEMDVLSLYQSYTGADKPAANGQRRGLKLHEFHRHLLSLCRNSLEGVTAEELSYAGGRSAMVRTLLLLNVAELVLSRTGIGEDRRVTLRPSPGMPKFDYAAFIEGGWHSVEHISPQHPGSFEKLKQIFADLPDKDETVKNDSSIATLQKAYKKAATEQDLENRADYKDLQTTLNKLFATEANDCETDLHHLGNVTLLTPALNSSLSNNLYGAKRRAMLAHIEAGNWVPQLTLAAFFKLNSQQASSPLFFTDDDRRSLYEHHKQLLDDLDICD